MLTDIIPAAWRKRVYAIYASIAAALGVVQAVYIATASAQPSWLTASLAVLAVVGTAIGVVAGANVTIPEPVVPEPTPVTPTVLVKADGSTVATDANGVETTTPGA